MDDKATGILIGGAITIAATAMGVLGSYLASRELDDVETRSAARGTARVLQDQYRAREAYLHDSLPPANTAIPPRPFPRGYEGDLGRIDMPPDDQKLLASNLDSDKWRLVSEANSAYFAFVIYDRATQREINKLLPRTTPTVVRDKRERRRTTLLVKRMASERIKAMRRVSRQLRNGRTALNDLASD